MSRLTLIYLKKMVRTLKHLTEVGWWSLRAAGTRERCDKL